MGNPGRGFGPLRVKVSDLDLSHMGHWAELPQQDGAYLGRLMTVDRSTAGALISFEGGKSLFNVRLEDELIFMGKASGAKFL